MSPFRKKKAAESVLKQVIEEAPKDPHLPLPDIIYVAESYQYYTLGGSGAQQLSVYETLVSAIRAKLKGRKVATYRLVEAKCYELGPQEVPCDKN